MNPGQLEKCGDTFNPELLAQAQQRTWEVITEVVAYVKPGMREEEALRFTNALLEKKGAQKRWHRSWVRFGENTLKPSRAPSLPGVSLQENDLFFLDLGPVWDGYEGDAGATFAVGGDAEMKRCADDCRQIWMKVSQRWLEAPTQSGATLYSYARELAAERDWELNEAEAPGHRLGDFPHAVHYRGNLNDLPFHPAPSRWVLEIQLRHRTRPFGAFYEDLLS